MENQQYQDYNEPLKIQLENLPNDEPKFSPNNPPWNSLMAVLAWLSSIFFIIALPIVGIAVYIIAKGFDPKDSTKLAEAIQSDPNAILVNIICVIPAHILTLAVAWFIVTQNKKYSFREMLGWKWGGFNILYLALIVASFLGLAIVLAQFIPEKDNDLLRILRSSRTNVYLVAFMATFTAPLVEEVIYRGIMYSAFQKTLGVASALGLTTLLFALVHVPQYYPSYSTIIMICLLSLVLTLVRVKSKNLLPCIILHTMFNGIQSFFLIAEPYLKQLSPEQPHPGIFILQFFQ